MGRQSTGAITTVEAQRIELSYLLRQKMIRQGSYVSGYLSWTNGSRISFASAFTEEEKYLRLSYYIEAHSGQRTNHDYKIQLTSIPSNLGKGEIIYFICPSTGRRARILYRCYGSPIWKSRTAYRYRIYYTSQQSSKYSYHNTRYWALEKELDKCQAWSKKKHYQGQETRIRRRIKYLGGRKNFMIGQDGQFCLNQSKDIFEVNESLY